MLLMMHDANVAACLRHHRRQIDIFCPVGAKRTFEFVPTRVCEDEKQMHQKGDHDGERLHALQCVRWVQITWQGYLD